MKLWHALFCAAVLLLVVAILLPQPNALVWVAMLFAAGAAVAKEVPHDPR